MSDLRFARRLAAEILKVGETRIWIDPEAADKVAFAISKEEIRKLIKEGVIRKRPKATPSRGRKRILKEKKRKGRRRGKGSRKGPRYDEKEIWVNRIRVQRRFLKRLRERKIIDASTYRRLYRLAKGGYFRTLRQLKSYIEEHKLARRF